MADARLEEMELKVSTTGKVYRGLWVGSMETSVSKVGISCWAPGSAKGRDEWRIFQVRA